MIVLASCDINDVGASVSAKNSTNRDFFTNGDYRRENARLYAKDETVNDVGGIFGRFFVS